MGIESTEVAGFFFEKDSRNRSENVICIFRREKKLVQTQISLCARHISAHIFHARSELTQTQPTLTNMVCNNNMT